MDQPDGGAPCGYAQAGVRWHPTSEKRTMSSDTHYSDAKDGVIPKRFLCRRKVKDDMPWTRHEPLVDCARCLAKLKEAERKFAANERQEEK